MLGVALLTLQLLSGSVLVADKAELLTTGSRNAVENYAREAFNSSDTSFGIVTIADTRGEEVQQVAKEVLNEWNPGANSVLILVTVKPRMIYLQPGADQTAAFDRYTSTNITDAIAAKMRGGDRAAAFVAAVDRVKERVSHVTTVIPPVVQTVRIASVTPVYEGLSIFSIILLILGGGILYLLVSGIWTWYKQRKLTQCPNDNRKLLNLSGDNRIWSCSSCGHNQVINNIEIYNSPMFWWWESSRVFFIEGPDYTSSSSTSTKDYGGSSYDSGGGSSWSSSDSSPSSSDSSSSSSGGSSSWGSSSSSDSSGGGSSWSDSSSSSSDSGGGSSGGDSGGGSSW